MECVQSRASRGVISRALLVARFRRERRSVRRARSRRTKTFADETPTRRFARSAPGVDVKIVTGDGERVARVTGEKMRVDHRTQRSRRRALRSFTNERVTSAAAGTLAAAPPIGTCSPRTLAPHRRPPRQGRRRRTRERRRERRSALRLAHVGVAAHDAADAGARRRPRPRRAPSPSWRSPVQRARHVARVREYVIFERPAPSTSWVSSSSPPSSCVPRRTTPRGRTHAPRRRRVRLLRAQRHRRRRRRVRPRRLRDSPSVSASLRTSWRAPRAVRRRALRRSRVSSSPRRRRKPTARRRRVRF